MSTCFDKSSSCTTSATATNRKFSQEHWQTDEQQTDDEEQEKRSPSVLTRNVREFPHVAQTNRTTNGRQDKSSLGETFSFASVVLI
ncbi:hypothetical protein D3C76_1408250 [compost metagenome]